MHISPCAGCDSGAARTVHIQHKNQGMDSRGGRRNRISFPLQRLQRTSPQRKCQKASKRASFSILQTIFSSLN